MQLSYIPVCILFSSFFNLFYSCLILWHTLSMFKKWQSHLSLQHYLDIFRAQMGVTKRYLHCRLQQSRMPAMVKSGKATSPSVRRKGFGFSGWWTSMATFLSTSLAMTPAQATPECAEWNEASLGLWAWRNRMIQRWVRLSTVGMSTTGVNNWWQQLVAKDINGTQTGKIWWHLDSYQWSSERWKHDYLRDLRGAMGGLSCHCRMK